jgi:hypothetical protein
MSLQTQQLALTAWLRDPQNSPALTDVASQRMQIYRELFFNNIENTLSNAFPVLHQVLPATDWQMLCEDFFSMHQCHTPHLSHLPAEFIDFAKTQTHIATPDWLIELAEWEWSELELFLAQDIDIKNTMGDNPIQGVPVVSPLLRLHQCRYPVHQIGTQFIPDAPSEQLWYLLAWRKPDHSIGFMQLTQLTALILEMMQLNQQQKTSYTGYQLLEKIAGQQGEYSQQSIIQGGSDCLSHFYKNRIIIGSQPASDQESQS